jgi:serine/threonine protein kinase
MGRPLCLVLVGASSSAKRGSWDVAWIDRVNLEKGTGIDARVAGSVDTRERFLREARAAARLRHPNVASRFYYGCARVMVNAFTRWNLSRAKHWRRVCAGRDRYRHPLRWRLSRNWPARWPPPESQELVHRDLKPSNLMLVQGPDLTVKVIDFGLAKLAVCRTQLFNLSDVKNVKKSRPVIRCNRCPPFLANSSRRLIYPSRLPFDEQKMSLSQ